MKKRQLYLETISKVEDLVYKQEISKTIIENLLEIKQDIQNFKVLIPIVGGFSAGKTSLINSYLGTDFPTDILPETAIATEIRYGEIEKAVVHSKSGDTFEYSIAEIKDIPTKEYTYMEVYLDNPKIKALGDVVIVDMPGLDSKIEEHNKAIFNYINEGVYYIIVGDIDYGLKESVLNFLSEVNMYNLDFSVILSKIDHKLPEDVEEVVNNVRSNVNMFAGREIFVGKTSTKTNEINDFEQILKNIDIEYMIENKFKDKIILILDKIIRELIIREKYISVDVTEIENRILDIKGKIKQIETKIEEEEQKVNEKLQNEVKNNIINDLKAGLNSNIYTLVQAAKNGNDAFTQTINEIIRPILTTSANNNMSFAFEESFRSIQQQSEDVLNMAEFMKNQGDRIVTTFAKTANIINNSNMNKKFMETGFKTISGILAITTQVVAPWVELVIFLLPEILQLLGVGSERRQDEKIKDKLEQEVIPQIIMKLKPEVSKYLEQANAEFISNIREEVSENKVQLIDSLQKIMREKELKEVDFEKNKEMIRNCIKELETYKTTL